MHEKREEEKREFNKRSDKIKQKEEEQKRYCKIRDLFIGEEAEDRKKRITLETHMEELEREIHITSWLETTQFML